jgi:hypothetical protein
MTVRIPTKKAALRQVALKLNERLAVQPAEDAAGLAGATLTPAEYGRLDWAVAQIRTRLLKLAGEDETEVKQDGP